MGDDVLGGHDINGKQTLKGKLEVFLTKIINVFVNVRIVKSKEMSKIINSLHKSGKTICISTHILSEVETLCTNVAILKNGRMTSTVELNNEFFHNNSYIINSSNISDCKKILNNIKPMHIKQVDKNNIFIQSKDKNYPKEVKKILSEANIDFIITKESNLMYYFND